MSSVMPSLLRPIDSASRRPPFRGRPARPNADRRRRGSITARTESPARSSGQRSSFSMAIRTGNALDDLGELAGDDVPRHQGKLCPG